MAKKSFTTRLDEEVLALADQLAKSERRSITAILEIALLEYARAKGMSSD